MSLQDIRSRYKVPAKRGQRVSVYGKPGTIRSSFRGRLRVELDAGGLVTCHPTDGLLYLEGGLTSE